MLTPLVPVNLPSIYNHQPLPARMAQASKDFAIALADLSERLPNLRWSDLFRSYEMQKAANADYLQGRKKAFSPPPGGSLHEAGRAMDIDLSTIGMSLADFWAFLKPLGMVPIINKPDSGISEAWHFEYRGSHQLVYDYAAAGNVRADISPYKQAAASAILGLGIHVDQVKDQSVALVQSALIRLGFDAGPIDGDAGGRTIAALQKAGATLDNAEQVLAPRLQESFPQEY
jgi:hypothetical protein